MNKHTKLYSVISYITWIGWLIALFARDKDDEMVKQHLNQGLVLNLVTLVTSIITRYVSNGVIASVCGIIDLAAFILCIMGIVRAVKLSDQPLPLVGGIKLIN